MTSHVSFADAMRASAGALLKSDVDIAKSAPTSRSRADWYAAIRKHAGGMRQPGQSIQQAVAVFISKGDGQVLHKAMSVAGGPSYIVDKGTMPSAMPDVSGGDGPGADDDDTGSPSFSDLVDRHQKANPSYSRSQSIDSVLGTREGRACMAIEKRTRLNKSLGLRS